MFFCLLIRLSSIAAARSDHNELRQVFRLIADADTVADGDAGADDGDVCALVCDSRIQTWLKRLLQELHHRT